MAAAVDKQHVQHVRRDLATHRLWFPGTGTDTTGTHSHPVVLLGELRTLRGPTLLQLLVLGHRFQGPLRVRSGRLQAHVLQCHAQQLQDVDTDRIRRNCPVRVHQASHRSDPAATCALLDDDALPALHLLALLCLVGVHQLLQ